MRIVGVDRGTHERDLRRSVLRDDRAAAAPYRTRARAEDPVAHRPGVGSCRAEAVHANLRVWADRPARSARDPGVELRVGVTRAGFRSSVVERSCVGGPELEASAHLRFHEPASRQACEKAQAQLQAIRGGHELIVAWVVRVASESPHARLMMRRSVPVPERRDPRGDIEGLVYGNCRFRDQSRRTRTSRLARGAAPRHAGTATSPRPCRKATLERSTRRLLSP